MIVHLSETVLTFQAPLSASSASSDYPAWFWTQGTAYEPRYILHKARFSYPEGQPSAH